MFAKKLELKNFRNYSELSLFFDEGLNIILGNNGQGKTNLLEALYYCAMLRSHRTGKDKDLLNKNVSIFNNEPSMMISLLYKRDHYEDDEKIQIVWNENFDKSVYLQQKKIKSNELFGNFLIASFSPEDLSLVKEGPSVRRRFMDMALCELDPIYLDNLQKYCKIVRERTNCIKQVEDKQNLYPLLDSYDIQLAHYGARIVKRRKDFLNDLAPRAQKIHTHFTSEQEILSLGYEGTRSQSEEEYLKCLASLREKDIHYGITLYGPHRDDIFIKIQSRNEKTSLDARSYGSQGQQRTAALSMKLSEIEMIESVTNEKPVLLLDDVMSELDESRQQKLLEFIKDKQTVITCTGAEASFENLQQCFQSSSTKIIQIEKGKI